MTFEKFEEIFKALDDSEKVELWNEFCDDYRYEETLFSMDELDDLLAGKKPSELLTMIHDDFNYNDDYFYFDGYGRLCSVKYLEIFFSQGRGDISEIYEYLKSHDRLQEFAEENGPDYNEEDWEEDEDEDEEDEDED